LAGLVARIARREKYTKFWWGNLFKNMTVKTEQEMEL
jgi:hypothetical protein